MSVCRKKWNCCKKNWPFFGHFSPTLECYQIIFIESYRNTSIISKRNITPWHACEISDLFGISHVKVGRCLSSTPKNCFTRFCFFLNLFFYYYYYVRVSCPLLLSYFFILLVLYLMVKEQYWFNSVVDDVTFYLYLENYSTHLFIYVSSQIEIESHL